MRYSELYQQMRSGTSAQTVPDWAHTTLRYIAERTLPVQGVRHPLGFLCLPLERDGARGVCVHVWSPELVPAVSTTSAVHCHSWELLSHVLYGQVTNVSARIDDGPATHQIYQVRSLPDRDELHATGRRVRYREGRCEVYRRGDVYTLPAGQFHSTVVPGCGAAATVALGESTGVEQDLSLGPLEGRTHLARRVRCDDAETARAAALVVAGLEVPGAC